MPSKSKLKRQQKSTAVPEEEKPVTQSTVTYVPDRVESDVHNHLEQVSATGLLDSQEGSSDIIVSKFSVSISNIELIQEVTLTISRGNRYGIIGANGCGKSSMMYALGHRLVELPKKMSTYYLEGESPPTDKTPLEFILDSVKEERDSLTNRLTETDIPEDELNWIYTRLDELDVDTATPKVARILHGLGFDKQMQQQMKTKEFSGGWRMRIALAQALYSAPDLLLLDEPSAHLDLESVIWLEGYLKRYPKSLLLVSHSQDFLNNVCTHIIRIHDKRFEYYGGNYDAYVSTKDSLEVNQMKRFKYEQEQIKQVKDYVARFGQGHRKMARQAKSKEKLLKKMEDKGLTERVKEEKIVRFKFPPCTDLPPPIISLDHVSFSYPASDRNPNPKTIIKDLDFAVTLESRIALVGRNGTGKSTLLKLMAAVLAPTSGAIRRHSHLRIAHYHQHLHELLDLELSPLDFMFREFKDEHELETNSEGIQRMRSALGPFGVTGTQQTSPMKLMSEGLRSRVVFAWLAFQNPHVLLLDEPTNSLSMDMIDSLAMAVNSFNGAMVLVSHDFRLIDQVAHDIYECMGDGSVVKFNGSIEKYKSYIRERIEEESEGL